MTVKTYIEFEELVEKRFKEYEELEAGRMRIGQVYFNTLDEVRPGIARKLRGSIIDPFHKTQITPPIRNFVIDNWNQ